MVARKAARCAEDEYRMSVTRPDDVELPTYSIVLCRDEANSVS